MGKLKRGKIEIIYEILSLPEIYKTNIIYNGLTSSICSDWYIKYLIGRKFITKGRKMGRRTIYGLTDKGKLLKDKLKWIIAELNLDTTE